MNLRFDTDDVKMLIDSYIASFDYKIARALFNKNKDELNKKFSEWSKQVREKLFLSTNKRRTDNRPCFEVIIDYDNEIANAEKSNDYQKLFRISKDIDHKLSNNRITSDDYSRLKNRINTIIYTKKYKEIFSLIRSNPRPETWIDYINSNKEIDTLDKNILNEILRVTTIRIKKAFEKDNIKTLAKHIIKLKETIKTDKTIFEDKINSAILECVDSYIAKTELPSDRKTKIEYFSELKLFSHYDKNLLLEKNRKYTINSIKTALSNLDFVKADSYGGVDGYNPEPDKKIAIEILQLKIYRNEIDNDTLIHAINHKVITPEEVSQLESLRITHDHKIGIEPNDREIIRDNKLIELELSEGMSFSFCLDLYTTGSAITDDGQFKNKYSELGQIIYNLKYSGLSDGLKMRLIEDKLVPIIINKTKGLSLWDRNITIVPMPFSKVRTLQPVYAIAKSLATKKDKAFSEDILYKNSHTEAKYSKDEFDDGVFTENYHGRPTSILIIDDTYGKGRSLRASVKALKRNPKIKNVYYMGIVKNRKGGLTG